ncbi:MAG: hypothetical protein HQK77_00400 [Desulfobacterales bacterium]|nr:hypothetical protein [Desulfobacterales bacterium]
MKINFKQEELITKLIDCIREKYPGVSLIDVTESPEDTETLWINITAPESEEMKIAVREFGSDKATDILLDYGYHMLIMPTQQDSHPSY